LPPVHGTRVRHGRGVGERDEDLRQRVLARHGRDVRLDAGPRVLGRGHLSAGRDRAADGIHAVRAGHQLSHRSGSGRSLAHTAAPSPDLTPLSCSNAKRATCTKKQPACGPTPTTADLAAPLACTLAPVFWCCYHAASRTGNGYSSFAVKRLSTLLRAKPSKDGDAELRDYGDASR